MITFNEIYSNSSNYYLNEMIKIINFRRQQPLTYIKLRQKRPQNYINCQRHHIIPRCIYKERQLPIDNSENNLICLTIKEHIEIHVLIYKYFSSIGNVKYADLTALSIRYLIKSPNVISYLNSIDHNSIEYQRLIDITINNIINAAKANKRINIGRIWVNNGIQNKFVFPDNIPNGYVKGRLFKDKKRFSNTMKLVNKGKNKGIRHYTNGITNLYISSNTVPDGFVPGITRHKKQKSYKHAKGYIYITNGKQNIRIQSSDIIPDGFKLGKTVKPYTLSQTTCNKISKRNKNRIWVTNGVQSKFVHKDHIPDGYHKGRIFKYVKRKPSSARNSIWVNNGVISKMVQPNQIPNGFVRGRLKKNGS